LKLKTKSCHEPHQIWSLWEKARILSERHEIWNRVVFFYRFKGRKGNVNPIHLQSLSFVLHVIEEVVMIANDYRVQGLGVVAISVTM
jgi:hypothetical protein